MDIPFFDKSVHIFKSLCESNKAQLTVEYNFWIGLQIYVRKKSEIVKKKIDELDSSRSDSAILAVFDEFFEDIGVFMKVDNKEREQIQASAESKDFLKQPYVRPAVVSVFGFSEFNNVVKEERAASIKTVDIASFFSEGKTEQSRERSHNVTAYVFNEVLAMQSMYKETNDRKKFEKQLEQLNLFIESYLCILKKVIDKPDAKHVHIIEDVPSSRTTKTRTLSRSEGGKRRSRNKIKKRPSKKRNDRNRLSRRRQ